MSPDVEDILLSWLERIEGKVDCIDKKVAKHGEAIAGLKARSGIWGLIGGAIPVVIGLAYLLLK